jgi:hypothetical protein
MVVDLHVAETTAGFFDVDFVRNASSDKRKGLCVKCIDMMHHSDR